MRSLVLCGGFSVLAALVGCSAGASPYSRSEYTVSGKVFAPTGEPIRGGAEIVLTPKAKEGGIFGKEGSALIGADGSFTIKSGENDGVPGGFYLVDDLLPQASWPEGHAAKVPPLIADLTRRPGFVATALAWSSGLLLLVRTQD